MFDWVPRTLLRIISICHSGGRRECLRRMDADRLRASMYMGLNVHINCRVQYNTVYFFGHAYFYCSVYAQKILELPEEPGLTSWQVLKLHSISRTHELFSRITAVKDA